MYIFKKQKSKTSEDLVPINFSIKMNNCKTYTIQGRRLGYTRKVEEGRNMKPGGRTILIYIILMSIP